MKAFDLFLTGQLCASTFSVTVPTTAQPIVARVDQPDQTEWGWLKVVNDSHGLIASSHGPQPEVFGLGTLFAVAIWEVAEVLKYKPFFQGVKWSNGIDCFFAAADLTANTITGVYEVYDTFTSTKRDTVPLLDGLPNYGNSTISRTKDGAGQDVHVWSVAHIPHNGTLMLVSADHFSGTPAANYSWAHHASLYVNDVKVQHLYHRLAHAEDLGAQNTGGVHQYRAQPSSDEPPSSLSSAARKRSTSTEKRWTGAAAGPLNVEYIWEHNNDKGTWEAYQGAGNDLGNKWAEKFEYHDIEAGCASPGFCNSIGGFGCGTDWNRVLAYAWNGGQFNWQGRAQGWLDQCYGTCTGDSCVLVGGTGV